MKFVTLFTVGVIAGSLLTIQSVLNSALGKKTGNLGSVLVLAIVSISLLLVFRGKHPSIRQKVATQDACPKKVAI